APTHRSMRPESTPARRDERPRAERGYLTRTELRQSSREAAVDLDIREVTILDGHALRPEHRVSTRDGLISEIGTGAAETPAARTITATARLLTPGFVDAPVHTTFGGQVSLACDLSRADGLDEALDALRLYLGSTEGWVTGGGWSMADFPGGAPTASILDEVTANRPIILLSADHHSAWVNRAAIDLVGAHVP